MSVRRTMGIETEYGVLAPGDPGANPMALSAHVVAAYAATRPAGQTARWDYEGEDPLADARGFRLDRAAADPSQLTDSVAERLAPLGPLERRRPDPRERVGASNVVLTNGARLYVDHAHPEYSSPEVRGPLDVVRWDRAGEEVMRTAARALAAEPAMPDVALYKNNVDGKGQSYGTHENYLMDRDVPFGDVARYLTPFLVTRQVFCGAGRVGLGQRSERPGFQISQRADYLEAEVGLETTFNRPIVNTRDEPHADAARYRRLHVIAGDANLLEVSTFLKVGTTALVLWLLEQGQVPLALDTLALADPVGEVHAVSHDPSLTRTLTLADGRELTALEIQGIYLEVVTEALEAAGDVDTETRAVLDRWSSVLTRLASDPASCAAEVEWVAKLRLLEGMRRRDGIAWDHPRLAALDLQWSDVRPEHSVYARLVAAGAVERLVPDDDVAACVAAPPEDTRAWLRGESIRRYGTGVAAAGWSSVVLDVPGAPTLTRVPMPDPAYGTRAAIGGVLDASADVAALRAALTGAGAPGQRN
ncbi:depupylase/deamidase Dop [Georgenia sp. MJ206]|uniref:depupylase/deamidase Dop n=1 Tax=Georgenia wangjunii TaxID=3117730 RepID=UPI002F26A87D